MNEETMQLPEEWGFCGCANEPAIKLLRDILRKMNEKGPCLTKGHEVSHDWVLGHIKEREALAGGSAHWELFMHYIDKMGWSEHGGGINSAWLTGEGERALELLEKLPLDEEEE